MEYSLQDLRDSFESEGVGYTICYGVNVAKIKDPYARQLAQEAVRALNTLTQYVDARTEGL